MYCKSESNKRYLIKKSEYNDLSHININYKKRMNLIEEYGIDKINKELSEATTHTIVNDVYVKYISIIRKHWEKLWNFQKMEAVKKLPFDTYVNKKKAISILVRRLIPRKKKPSNNYKKKIGKTKNIYDPYFDEKLYETKKNKPVLMAIGKGNGNITINNTKGSSSKGPVKLLIAELSKCCLVILTDENNTSQEKKQI